MNFKKALMVAILVPLLSIMPLMAACSTTQTLQTYSPIGLQAFRSLVTILQADGKCLVGSACADTATKIEATFMDAEGLTGQCTTLLPCLSAIAAELPQFGVDAGLGSNDLAVQAGLLVIETTIAIIQAHTAPPATLTAEATQTLKTPVPSSREFAKQFNAAISLNGAKGGHPEAQIKVPASTLTKVVTFGIAK